jgi:hypothetical protein
MKRERGNERGKELKRGGELKRGNEKEKRGIEKGN